MAMSRKNYVAVAETFRVIIESPGYTSDERHVAAGITRQQADYFKADNPNFRYDTFFAACGLDAFGNLKT